MQQSVISELVYRASNSCHIICLILVITAVGMIHRVALGQCELQTIWSPDGGGEFYTFGLSAVGSATMNVIVLGENGRDNLSGAAYIYRLIDNQWQLEEMFVASDGPQIGTQFGKRADMSADGKTVIISELLDANNGLVDAGAVWVYVEEGGKWEVQQKLTASDAEDGWVFGQRLALSADGNVAAISATGAPGDPIYVFTRNGSTWTEAQILARDGFGGLPWVDVSANGSVIIVGAGGDPEQGQGAGAAYIFMRSKDQGLWGFHQKLLASDGVAFDHFGRDPSLSATGDTIIMGAVGNDDAGNSTGAAYVFQKKGDMWFEQVKLLASDLQDHDFFGASTKLTPDGQRAIIKSSNNAPYIFDLIDGNWVETKRLTSSDPNIVSLGDAIAISDDGSTALLGGPSSKVDGVFWYGAAALFDLDSPLGDLNCDGSISVTDLLELLENWGSCFYWDPEDGCEFFGGCPADLDFDCQVGTNDLLILLSNWG